MKLQITRGALGLPLAHPAVLIGTWGGVGLIPFAPGTWGSLAALPFCWAVATFAGPWGMAAAALAIGAAGAWAAQQIIARIGREDPGQVCVDEVAGMFVTLALAPVTWWSYALGFVLFRAADILKPWPADWCDRNLHGGVGAMADDMLAALWSAAALWLIARFVPVADVLARFGL